MTYFLAFLLLLVAIIFTIIASICLAVGLRLFTYKDRYPVMTRQCMVYNKKENRIELSYGPSWDAVRKNLL